jgi:hypothetical protein
MTKWNSRNHASGLKANVALAISKEDRTLTEVAHRFDLHLY